MVAGKSVASEFAHDQRLVVLRAPTNNISIGRAVDIPTDVLVVPHDIQLAGNGIADADGNMIVLHDFAGLESR